MLDGIVDMVQNIPEDNKPLVEQVIQKEMPTDTKEPINNDKLPEDNPEIPIPRPKQYILLADEMHMIMLSKIMPGLQFLIIEGMNIPNNPDFLLLANPVPKQPKTDQ